MRRPENGSWKKWIINAAMAVLIWTGCISARACAQEGASPGFSGNRSGWEGKYIRAVTYFGASWPAAFWNSSGESLKDDFSLIREDGFNAVILVIPWNEFAPERLMGELASYPRSFLERILDEAAAEDLMVYLRLGYAWDFSDDAGTPGYKRMDRVLYDEDTQQEFLAFVSEIYRIVSGKKAFSGAFLCWEDFWSLAVPAQEEDSLPERIRRARECGLQAYLSRHYTQKMMNSMCGTQGLSAQDIPFPTARDSLLSALYAYYDDCLCRLLEKTQEVFPGVTMEVRSDLDPVTGTDGTQSFYEHRAFFKTQEPFLCAMYGIYQGWNDQGMALSAQQALKMTQKTLRLLKQKCIGKAVFLEQFNYTDNTPGYEDHARMDPDQERIYLENAGSLLREMVSGYGLWTWRDYKTDVLFNGQFVLGRSGWTMGKCGEQKILTCGMKHLLPGMTVFFQNQDSQEGKRAADHETDKAPGSEEGINPSGYVLTEGTFLSQTVPAYRKLIEADAWILELEVETQEPARVSVRAGDRTYEIEGAVSGKYVVLTDQYSQVRISADRDILVRRVRLWNHMQSQSIRGADLQPLDSLPAICQLNRQLQ